MIVTANYVVELTAHSVFATLTTPGSLGALGRGSTRTLGVVAPVA